MKNWINLYTADDTPVAQDAVHWRTYRQGETTDGFKTREGTYWAEVITLDKPEPVEGETLVLQPDIAVEVEGVKQWHQNRYTSQVVPPRIPESVTRAQFIEELHIRGIKVEVEAIIAAGTDHDRIWYENAAIFYRDNPRVVAINSIINSPVDLDDFFLSASNRDA